MERRDQSDSDDRALPVQRLAKRAAGDGKSRFSSRVQNYVRYRPGYPQGVVDLLAREIGLEAGWVIADVGSGTGIASRLFLDHGNTVFAVEPNREMREAAEALLSDRAGFHSLDGAAEATGLKDASVDLAIAAQAFHWFDPEAARSEFRRILKPDRCAALMWNMRKTRGSAFLSEYEQLLLRFGTDYTKVRQENVGAAELAQFFGAGDYRTAVLQNQQRLDHDGLRGRLLSSSYTPTPEQPGYDPMLAALAALFDRHQSDGVIVIEYAVEIFWGRMSQD